MGYVMNNLVVLGSVNADHVLRVPSFPRPGETLLGGGYQVVAGGKGANQAVAAARLGAKVSFIACVGDDAFGQQMVQHFQQEGINISAVMIEKGANTGVAMIQVTPEGENSICLSPEANQLLNAQRVAAHTELLRQADYLLLQLETPIEGIMAAINIAKSSGAKVVLNPAPAQSLPDELVAQLDMITPNETEAEMLTGVRVDSTAAAQAAADVLHNKGVPTVLITLGARGVWVSHEVGHGENIKGFSVKVKDTTAAGDTFNAALLTALLERQFLDHAITFAHAAAALSVTKAGAQTSIPYREEVEKFLGQDL